MFTMSHIKIYNTNNDFTLKQSTLTFDYKRDDEHRILLYTFVFLAVIHGY